MPFDKRGNRRIYVFRAAEGAILDPFDWVGGYYFRNIIQRRGIALSFNKQRY